MKTVQLYRPVGIREYELILESDSTCFPPRLSWQPIFYPVLNQPYAEQIACEWNTLDEFSGYCGIVTQFALSESHYNTYVVQEVGGSIHNELWVPAEELTLFNEHIVGKIEVVKVFLGEKFIMPDSELLTPTLLKFR
ncbi:hypothetical protein SAMN05421788_108243 [Filimonas lacunae]|uniref:ADP-ribosylation/crystallin J1 n=1 Tax=Filimonas lacunae TaxID=477680 RepID=A0A173MDE4_9BACT|nr:ADP-ribosylation/crystallin J1 [Filimonas lacunae]BAV05612.1 hypothetical protein FLA_1623 [Filimonas lacunae]SIT29197.1 hypothetical protein SAMN05421788_108243 [Filimonas lacunae]